jgi:hypothetical protein
MTGLYTKEIRNKIAELRAEYPNATSIGWGKKVVGGVETDEFAIRIAVAKKQPISKLKSVDIVPNSVEVGGEIVKTDVIEHNQVLSLSCNSLCGQIAGSNSVVNRSYTRPLIGGLSMSTLNNCTTVGTMGGIVKHPASGTTVGLTNNHVSINDAFFTSDRNINGILQNDFDGPNKLYQPGESGCTVPAANFCGLSLRYVPIHAAFTNIVNQVDAAIFAINETAFNINQSWKQAGLEAFLGSEAPPFASTSEIDNLLVEKSYLYSTGRTTGPKGGADCPLAVHALGVSFSIGYQMQSGSGTPPSNLVTCLFDNAIAFVKPQVEDPLSTVPGCYNPIAGGDSGSFLLANIRGTTKIIGLVFAGSTDNTGQTVFGFACRIDDVAEQLGIAQYVSTDTTAGIMVDQTNITYITVDGASSEKSVICDIDGKEYWQVGFTDSLQNDCAGRLPVTTTTTTTVPSVDGCSVPFDYDSPEGFPGVNTGNGTLVLSNGFTLTTSTLQTSCNPLYQNGASGTFPNANTVCPDFPGVHHGQSNNFGQQAIGTSNACDLFTMEFDHGCSALAFYVSGIGYITPATQYEVVEFTAIADTPTPSIIPLNIDLAYACNDLVVENMPNGAVRMKGRIGSPVAAVSGIVNIYPVSGSDKITKLEIAHVGDKLAGCLIDFYLCPSDQLPSTTTTTTTPVPTTTTTTTPVPTTTTTTTAPTTTFDCTNPDLSVSLPDGIVGDPLNGSVIYDGNPISIISYTWSGGTTTVYQSGSVSYTISFIVPAGYTNSGAPIGCAVVANGTTPTTSTTSTTTTIAPAQYTVTSNNYSLLSSPSGAGYSFRFPSTSAPVTSGAISSSGGASGTYSPIPQDGDTLRWDLEVFNDTTTEVRLYGFEVEKDGVNIYTQALTPISPGNSLDSGLQDTPYARGSQYDFIVNVEQTTTTTTTPAPTTTTTTTPVPTTTTTTTQVATGDIIVSINDEGQGNYYMRVTDNDTGNTFFEEASEIASNGTYSNNTYIVGHEYEIEFSYESVSAGPTRYLSGQVSWDGGSFDNELAQGPAQTVITMTPIIFTVTSTNSVSITLEQFS